MNQELQELLEALDMESYLDHEGIEFRHRTGSSGPQLNIKTCPGCGRSDWKVYMGVETGLGKCFHGSCELGSFNKWSFVKAHVGEAASNRDVVTHIKTVAGVLGWRPKRQAKATATEKATLALPASIPMPDANGDVHQYLLRRGFGPEICAYFQLRYCHKGCFAFMVNGQRNYQDYSNRVIIPVFDMDGELASFQGRDVTGTHETRYLFPPGFASTGSLLFNGHNVWGVKRLAIGEGVFDVMALKVALDGEFQLRDVVPIGTFGMHLAEGQLSHFVELHKAGLEEVTIMWDGEKKAIQAALKTAQRISKLGIQVRIALLPPDKDPNDISATQVREAYLSAHNVSRPSGMTQVLRRIL